MEEETRLEELLTCPVCRDIFRDPRQLPCGHNLCVNCVKNLVDHASDVPLRCPDCRANVEQTSEIQKSYVLASIAEDFRLTKTRKEKEAEHVYCDCCPEKQTLAVKTCLKCEVSLCKEHVEDHQELRAFTGHPLVEPLRDLLERKCPQHRDVVLRYYCSSSRRYICNICALESKQLNVASETSTALRHQLTKYMDQQFKMLRDQITESTDALNNQLDRLRANQADFGFNGVTVVLLFLWFIVLYYAYNYSVENQTLTVELEKQQNRMHLIYSAIAEHMVGEQLKCRPDLKPEAEGVVLLDLDSASRLLGLSADLRTAERVKLALDYPDNNIRFDEVPQVLSSPCFSSGTHVWEVEAEGRWDIAVSYRSIQRKSSESSVFGHNAESWSLQHSGEGELFVCHNKHKMLLSETTQSSRITVEVNFEEGSISYSAVDANRTQLHRFKVELTQPVCLGFGLHQVTPPSRASIVKAA